MAPRRQSAEVAANDATRLLNDPAFKLAVQRVTEDITRNIRRHEHDGSEAADLKDLELCRELRVLEKVVSKIGGQSQRGALQQYNEGLNERANGKRQS